MKHCVYILYSESLDKFYIGETEELEERLEQHAIGFFKSSYTSKVKDWELFLSIECEDRVMARALERHIKQNKSRKYIQDLKAYADIRKKLTERFSSRGPQSR